MLPIWTRQKILPFGQELRFDLNTNKENETTKRKTDLAPKRPRLVFIPTSQNSEK